MKSAGRNNSGGRIFIWPMKLFYLFINRGYRLIFGRSYMLHAPLFSGEADSLLQAQINFCEYCLSFLPSMEGKKVIDVGCGNGTMTLHILEKHKPSLIYGIDIVSEHIEMARTNGAPAAVDFQGRAGPLADQGLGKKNKFEPSTEVPDLAQPNLIIFAVDDAQHIKSVGDSSFDALVCLESALHYPDKEKFLSEVKRVVKPGGHFMIADLLLSGRAQPLMLRKMLRLYNWPRDRYLDGFNRHHLELLVDQPLNDLLLENLGNARKAILRNVRSQRPATSFLLFPVVWLCLHFYFRQLRRHFEYRLFVGRA